MADGITVTITPPLVVVKAVPVGGTVYVTTSQEKRTVVVSAVGVQGPAGNPGVVEAASQAEEDAAFAAGAKIVIRTDLL